MALAPGTLNKARNFGYLVPKKKVAPKPVIPYLSQGYGNLAANKIYTDRATLAASLLPTALDNNNSDNSNSSNSGASSASSSVWDPNAYLNQLKSDPLYGSALESFGNALQKARLGLRGSIQEAVIRSGFDPRSRLTGDLAGYAADIDEGTSQAAASNQLSQRALLEQGLSRATKNLSYANAARGGLRSGMTTAGMSQLTRENQIATNDAMSQLSDAIRGGVSGYMGVESQLMSQRDQALEAVASRLAQLQGPAPDLTDPNAPDNGASNNGASNNVVTTPGAAPVLGKDYSANSFYTPAPGAVEWGGQQFNTKAAMARWLSARGASYATWAARHHDLAARLS